MIWVATQKVSIRGGCVPESKPLPFHIAFLKEKIVFYIHSIENATPPPPPPLHIPTEGLLHLFCNKVLPFVLRCSQW